ncbi:hypothetical protein HK102_001418 [Quaeritorhiza haematococci]|nr:hypothetical protein HK102_001418 [Quaeritorhiza haematococci]
MDLDRALRLINEEKVQFDDQIINALKEDPGLLDVTDNHNRGILHHAAGRGRSRIIEYIISNEEERIEETDKYGETPLHRSCRFGKLDAARKLLDAGVDIDAQDAKGETPLHIAGSTGKTVIVKLLFQRGADANVLNKDGKTALEMAKSSSKTNAVCLRLLEEYEMRERPREAPHRQSETQTESQPSTHSPVQSSLKTFIGKRASSTKGAQSLSRLPTQSPSSKRSTTIESPPESDEEEFLSQEPAEIFVQPVKKSKLSIASRSQHSLEDNNVQVQTPPSQPDKSGQQWCSLDGHICRNRYHLCLDNWLYERQICHSYQAAYDKEMPLSDSGGTFWLPAHKTKIQVWSVDEKDKESGDFVETRQKWKELYEREDHAIIELFPSDIDRLDEILQSQLLE